ncbi:MAG: hypothetical protein P8Y60_15430 [Calditrichota bacterium]
MKCIPSLGNSLIVGLPHPPWFAKTLLTSHRERSVAISFRLLLNSPSLAYSFTRRLLRLPCLAKTEKTSHREEQSDVAILFRLVPDNPSLGHSFTRRLLQHPCFMPRALLRSKNRADRSLRIPDEGQECGNLLNIPLD